VRRGGGEYARGEGWESSRAWELDSMGGGDVRPTYIYVSRPTVLSRTSTFCTGGRRPSSGAKRLPPIAAQNTTLPHPAMKVLRAWFVRGRSKRTGGAHSKLGTIATSGGGGGGGTILRALSGGDSASAHLARDHSPLAGPAFFFFTDAREDMEYVSARCCTATSADPPPRSKLASN